MTKLYLDVSTHVKLVFPPSQKKKKPCKNFQEIKKSLKFIKKLL